MSFATVLFNKKQRVMNDVIIFFVRLVGKFYLKYLGQHFLPPLKNLCKQHTLFNHCKLK